MIAVCTLWLGSAGAACWEEKEKDSSMALQDDAAVRVLAKGLMVLSEDRHRASTAVGGAVRPADWRTAKEEQVCFHTQPGPWSLP